MKRVLTLSLLCSLACPVLADTPVAKVGTLVLTDKQMQDDLGASLYDAENQVYQLKKNWVTQKAKNYLFDEAAKNAGLSRADWDKKEIEDRIKQPSEADINQTIQRYGQGRDPAQIRPQVVGMLMNQKRQAREEEVMQKLLKTTPMEITIAKPIAPHIPVTLNADDPVKGSKKASVTIIEFTDFECPYCKRSQPTLHQIEAAYPKDVKLVAKQYPLPMHGRAKPSAEAALCAHEQGKFWEFRDKLFPSSSLQDTDYQTFGKAVGLNMKKFDQCMAEHRYASRIDSDIAEGQRVGVHGTPYFFINGRPINGAREFSVFDEAIKDELETAKKQ